MPKDVCKNCNGLGWIPNPNKPKSEFDPVDCPNCGGTGIIEKK